MKLHFNMMPVVSQPRSVLPGYVVHAGSIQGCDPRTHVAPLQRPLQYRNDTATRCRTHRTTARATKTTSMETASAGPVQELMPPYRVLITGSTKGVGRALAEEFVRAGDSVVITSRDAERVAAAVRELQQLADSLGNHVRAVGVACNVAKASDVAALADYAVEQLGGVDLWINNAGSNAYKFDLLAEANHFDLMEIVETNVLGTMLCCKEAVRVMRDQPSGGHMFLMDGAGADGNATPRFAAYGATKRSLEQLSKSLAAELRMLDIQRVGVHNLSPGMVTTELLMAGANTPTAKFFINCLAEPAEEVAQFLVPRVRRVPQESKALGGGISPQYIRFLTPVKAYSQIAARLVLGQRKGRYVEES